MKVFVYGVLAVLVATTATAQVGHPPAQSPYADLEHTQELTALGGWLRARHDPAGVAPQSAPLVGLRYELSLTGPLSLSSDVVGSSMSRNVIDPSKVTGQRDAGTQQSTMIAADLALALNLTGRKSWRRMVPQLRAGLGAVHSSAKDESSGFAFGTQFAFSLGGGLKFVPGGGSRLQLRADLTDRIFKLSYPDAYYRLASDNTAVLESQTPRSFYTHHAAFTVGVSYLFGR